MKTKTEDRDCIFCGSYILTIYANRKTLCVNFKDNNVCPVCLPCYNRLVSKRLTKYGYETHYEEIALLKRLIYGS